MHIRSSLVRSLSAISLSLSPALWAQTQAPEVPQTLEQAAAQRARAAQMVNEADKRYADEKAICYTKFLVNGCLADASKRHTDALIEARNVDIPARDFQREARRADVEAKEAKREADRPLREADQTKQGESYRADEAAKAAEREKKIAAKEQQAAEGRQKLAEEQAKRQAKQQQREKRDAELAAKRAAKRAAKAPPVDAPQATSP